MIRLTPSGGRPPAPMGARGGIMLRGLGIEPLVSDTEALRQQGELKRMRSILANVRTNATENFRQWEPGVAAVANVVAAAESGDAEATARSSVALATTIVSMAGPIGAAIGAVYRALSEVLLWLVHSYPAHAIECYWDGTPHRMLARVTVRAAWLPGPTDGLVSDAARLYRDDGRVFAGVYSVKQTGGSWNRTRNAEPHLGWGDPFVEGFSSPTGSAVPWEYARVAFDQGTVEHRLLEFSRICIPIRRFVADPPVGFATWFEYITTHPDYEGANAAIALGAEIWEAHRERLDPQYVSDLEPHCAFQGFLYKVAGLPNESLQNLLRWITTETTEGAAAAAEERVYIPESGPEAVGMYWEDGLTYWSRRWIESAQPDFKTYHAYALINEYNRRIASGEMTRMRAPATSIYTSSRRDAVSRLPKGSSVAVKVGAVSSVAQVKSQKPYALRTSVMMPIGTALPGKIGDLLYECDCREVSPGEVDCKCRGR